MTTTSVDRYTASDTEWVMNSPANCCSTKSRRSSSLRRSRVISSRAPNGSSNRNSSGSSVRERASETRIRMPPESCFGRFVSKPPSPTRSMARAAFAARSAFDTCPSSASSSTLPCTVRHGSRVASWNTYPMRSAATSADPSDADSRPEAMRRRVDLPQPEGPTTETNCPRPTVRSTPCRAMVPFGKVISTFRKSSSVSVVVTGGGAVVVTGTSGSRVTGSRWWGEGVRRGRVRSRGRAPGGRRSCGPRCVRRGARGTGRCGRPERSPPRR